MRSPGDLVLLRKTEVDSKGPIITRQASPLHRVDRGGRKTLMSFIATKPTVIARNLRVAALLDLGISTVTFSAGYTRR
jgi:hypothetical protein